MRYLFGLIIWVLIGLASAAAVRLLARVEGTTPAVNFIFGVFGALVGGMLGVSAYIFHDPAPTRFGGLLGAVLGGVFFTYLYHYIARKVV